MSNSYIVGDVEPQTGTGVHNPTGKPYLLSREVTNDDHIKGEESASVTLLMYGAYECPHCVEGHEFVRQIQQYFLENLRFVFRHFPRTNVHPHAEAAAEVAEAAGEQDKFWEMHERLFENHRRLDGEHLVDYAKEIGLDMVQFERTVSGRFYAGKVREDLISGMESGVVGTPTYFINGSKHMGSGQYEALAEAIDTVLLERTNATRD